MRQNSAEPKEVLNMSFSQNLVPFLFTAPLPPIPVSHQLSIRECFSLLVKNMKDFIITVESYIFHMYSRGPIILMLITGNCIYVNSEQTFKETRERMALLFKMPSVGVNVAHHY